MLPMYATHLLQISFFPQMACMPPPPPPIIPMPTCYLHGWEMRVWEGGGGQRRCLVIVKGWEERECSEAKKGATVFRSPH